MRTSFIKSLKTLSLLYLVGLNFLFMTSLAWAQPQNLDQKPNEPPYTNPDELDLNSSEDLSLPDSESLPPSPAQTQPQQKIIDPAPKKSPSTSADFSHQPAVRSSSEGTKIFHPNAAKGLYMIDRTTGKYYYKTEMKTKKEKTMSLRIGTYEAPSITATTSTGQISFSDIYPESAPAFLVYDYEWPPFKKFPQLGVQLGVGFFMTQGNGILQTNPAQQAKEKYTFIALPMSLGLIYRFEFYPKQWVVPYASGGGTYFGLIETRDDGKDNHFVGSPAAYAAGGLLLNLSIFDRQSSFIFDREYGINNLWLAAEFRLYQSFSDDLDMSSNVINVGITVDY